MKSSVIIFPGSNCDRDMDVALKKFGFKNEMVWHNDQSIPKSDLIVLPGGFSYGDYLRCGSIASKSKIIKSVIGFANSGGLVLGICNGCQILVNLGIVPGLNGYKREVALVENDSATYQCRWINLKVTNQRGPWLKKIKKLFLPVAHGEGKFIAEAGIINKLNKKSPANAGLF